jgi:CHASE3 domain sensor protein
MDQINSLDNAVNTAKDVVDAAQLAAQNVAEVSQLAGNPEALANTVLWLSKRLTEAENTIALLQSPEAKAAEEAVETAGEAVVKAIPASWIEKMEALAEHASNALGFRFTPKA